MTALYLERYLNYGLTREELQSGKPIIGIAQTGNDLVALQPASPRARARVRDGIREMPVASPLEFPIHPIQENLQAADRGARPQPAYLGWSRSCSAIRSTAWC
jgi:dihydroxyacid dehydratase/phosphogluconate dehydratase